jgi:hypothetical protein
MKRKGIDPDAPPPDKTVEELRVMAKEREEFEEEILLEYHDSKHWIPSDPKRLDIEPVETVDLVTMLNDEGVTFGKIAIEDWFSPSHGDDMSKLLDKCNEKHWYDGVEWIEEIDWIHSFCNVNE